ncbi:60S ribosomal protein L5 [Gossypium australe]|uniref:60S ribosomal protein L5 n=1 Tax=Gossypium australe TaxID=47621 RepID=A0A5B6UNC6_9ROSI|nr:60S ribosomal protein L5 [Gossypium australe]
MLLRMTLEAKNVNVSVYVGMRYWTVTLSLAGAMLRLNVGDQRQANAARRPAPPPPEEKKDPSVSGVQAKVLASKKRKEAMKQAMAKMREKGKPVDGITTI